MEYEVSPLFVRNTAVRFIGIVSLIKANNQSLIFWLAFIVPQGIVERLGADHKRKTTFCWGVKNLLEDTFNIGCPALVEPEVGRIGMAGGELMVRFAFRGKLVVLRDAISEPRVGEFVDNNIYQGSVAGQESCGDL